MNESAKVPCEKCGAKILPTTAENNGGLCFPCKDGRRESIEERKHELARAKSAPPEPEFICLECGSKQWRSEMHANTMMTPDDPWSMATSRVECWDCGAIMPRELARRWNNISIEEAKKVWVEKFRNDKRSRVKNA
jgi:DNA-directed RNA polymerase subunit RPC12/RpoP